MDILAKIELRVKFKKDIELIELYEDTNWNDSLFCISEYSQCEITFLSDLSDSKLWLEYMNEDGGVYIYPNQSFELIKTNFKDEGYVPGKFSLFLYKDSNEYYEGYFTVTPHNISQKTLDLMQQCIEDKAYGLSRNLYLKKKCRDSMGYSEDDLYALLYLVNNRDYILQTFQYIEKNPIINLTQVYDKSSISRKPTVKSQRWQVIKGYTMVTNQNKFYYEPKKVLSDDNKANQYIKHQLYELMTKFSLLRNHHEVLKKQLNNKNIQLKKEIDELMISLSRFKNNFNTTKSNGIINHELDIKQKELQKYQNQIENYEKSFKPINDLYSHLVYLLNETWLENINLCNNKTFSKSLLKNKGYLNLYNIIQELNKKQDIGHTNFYFPQHQTTKLFEFYCVLLVMDIIQSKGFNWESGWLQEQEMHNKSHTCTLNSGEEMTFIHNSGYTLKLSYDKFLNMSFEARKQGVEQLVSVNSSNRRPDIILELFDDNRNFIRALIVEVKYRRLTYLYNKHDETNPMRQLAAYRELNYYDPSQNPSLIRFAVDSVVVLYPEHDGSRLLQDEDYGFKFIPILPINFNVDDGKFDTLVNTIDQFLKQFIPSY